MRISREILLALLAMLVVTTRGIALSISSGVRIGGPSQSYYIGVAGFGPIRPIIGVDYWGGNIEFDYTRHYEENIYGDRWESDDELRAEGVLRLIMPRVGIKYFRAPKRDLKSYLLAEGFIVIPTVEFKTTSDGETDELEKEDKDRIKDALDFIGFTLGLGTEYYFSDQFSIGGEFGINWLLWDFKDEDSDKYYDSADYNWSEEYKYDLKGRLSGGFARMTLNYYF